MFVKDLEEKDLQFIDTSQEVEEIKKHLGRRAKEFDSFFVRVEDGDYAEVYGMRGIVPYKNRYVEQLVPYIRKRRPRNRWFRVRVLQEAFFVKVPARNATEAKNQAWIHISAMRMDLNDYLRIKAEEITKEEYEMKE